MFGSWIPAQECAEITFLKNVTTSDFDTNAAWFFILLLHLFHISDPDLPSSSCQESSERLTDKWLLNITNTVYNHVLVCFFRPPTKTTGESWWSWLGNTNAQGFFTSVCLYLANWHNLKDDKLFLSISLSLSLSALCQTVQTTTTALVDVFIKLAIFTSFEHTIFSARKISSTQRTRSHKSNSRLHGGEEVKRGEGCSHLPNSIHTAQLGTDGEGN